MEQETQKKASKKKSWISNILFIGLIAAVLFTPLGSKLKILTSKLMASFSPSVQKVEKRERLTDYQWQLTDDSNQPFNLSQAQGKVIFLNTWATWCPPCIAEMPIMQDLYNKYRDNPDVVFVFATTDPKPTVDKFMADKGYNLLAYYIQSAPPKQLASNTIPITFLIGKKGDIAIRKVGAADWNSRKVTDTIDQLLKE
ncbi:MAG: TlpA disulfide reductase family protein [Petrimonas sp.]|nr:TlpA disulfide reductase family protein [Petrimonas sp.]